MKELEVCAGILLKDKKVLIGKRRAYDRFGGKWEFPGGKIEDGELPEDCIIRELKEELNIDIMNFKDYNSYVYHFEDIDLIIHSFLIHDYEGNIERLEHDKLLWVAIKELKYYDILEGDIPLIDYLSKDIK